MKNLRSLLVILPLLFGACGEKTGPAGEPSEKQTAGVKDAATQVVDLLKGITDTKTAESAKGQLESLTGKLSGALGKLKSVGKDAGGDAKNAITDLAKKAAGALSPELTKSMSGITAQVTRLLGIADVKGAIGPLLEKLQGLLPK